MTNYWEEKRRSPRLKLTVPVRYQVRGKPKSNNVLTENISLGGIGLIDEKFIPPATTVMLEINLPSKVLNPVGRVTWSAPFPHSDRYHSGIEFLELDPDQKRHLSDYLNMRRIQI